MAMIDASDERFDIPGFLLAPRIASAPSYEGGRPRSLTMWLSDVWGAIRWSFQAILPRPFHQLTEDSIMNDMQEIPHTGRRAQLGQPALPSGTQQAQHQGPAATDPVQALNAIVQRIRVLDGEKQANAILAGMLDASNQVLAKFGAAPADHRSAELDSLHEQLRRFQAQARADHEELLSLRAAAMVDIRKLASLVDAAGTADERGEAVSILSGWETEAKVA